MFKYKVGDTVIVNIRRVYDIYNILTEQQQLEYFHKAVVTQTDQCTSVKQSGGNSVNVPAYRVKFFETARRSKDNYPWWVNIDAVVGPASLDKQAIGRMLVRVCKDARAQGGRHSTS